MSMISIVACARLIDLEIETISCELDDQYLFGSYDQGLTNS